MTPGEFLVIIALCGYAVYKQSRSHEVVGAGRFKIAIIYGIVGVVIGGFNLPRTPLAILFLVISLALSVGVGTLRGRLQPLWREADGSVWTRGTTLTIGLFLGMVAVKFGLGTIAYFAHATDDGGIGEVVIMIAIMVAFQAELIWRRAQAVPAAARPAAPEAVLPR